MEKTGNTISGLTTVHPQVITYVALFFVALSTLMFELVLTRIFSATTWYHFAFAAISVAMFGMTAGAIFVYLLPRYFANERVHRHLEVSAELFAIWIVISVVVYLRFPFEFKRSFHAVLSIGFVYTILAVPFFFSGICVCLSLTRFPHHVGKLYASDLAGAAIGCILVIYLLDRTDGPSAVLIIAFLTSIGALLFAFAADFRRFKPVTVFTSLAMLIFAILNVYLATQNSAWLSINRIRRSKARTPTYEKWNSFSRLQVYGDPLDRTRSMWLVIDSVASTELLSLKHPVERLERLKAQSSNTVHQIRKDAKVLVIGSGGGRDVVSSLLFNQKSVVAVEINKDILKAVNRRFGDFTGHLDQNPRVTFVNDEARSYIARIAAKFDVIQVNFIDTFAATSAGAFALTENSIYTVEAWKIFLQHLEPRGVLTLTRFYFDSGFQGEAYRLISLAVASLKQLGVKDPATHIVLVTKTEGKESYSTILVSKDIFSDEDLNAIDQLAAQGRFRVLYTSRSSDDTTIKTLVSDGDAADKMIEHLPLNIAAPTDDKPFFFQMLRLRDIFHQAYMQQGLVTFNITAVLMLAGLLIVITVLTVFCILIPLIVSIGGKGILSRSIPFSFFFGAIGLGFIIIELSQMQRLILFLGHPAYSLSVVIFALLLSGGAGSFATSRMQNFNSRKTALVVFGLLLGVLFPSGIFTPFIIRYFQAYSTQVRILIAIALLIPAGFFMGMPFPLGMKNAHEKWPLLTPWLWAINGAMSVLASVLTTAIALTFGLAASFWTGFVCYLVAFTASTFAFAGKRSELLKN